jgi:hypothetical protein
MMFHVRRATPALALIACVLGCNLFEGRAADLFPDRVETGAECPDGPGCVPVPACRGVAYAGCEVPVSNPCGELEPCVASCGADCDGPREPDAVAPELDAGLTEEPDAIAPELEPESGPTEEPRTLGDSVPNFCHLRARRRHW